MSRAYATRVAAVRRMSPHFVRFTLADEELRHFHTGGLDQRIKLFLPRPDGTFPDLGLWREPQPSLMEWYNAWRALAESERNPIRTYTVRDIRPAEREIDVDFVVHGTEGPASAWALSAAPGDELIVIGPDGRHENAGAGIEWSPGTATEVLLAGDETAVPAICAILESLPETFTGEAYLEVPSEQDVLPVRTASAVAVHWLPRDGAALGEPLTAAVRDWGRRRSEGAAGGGEEFAEIGAEDPLWEVSEPEGFREYAWLAGEAGVITALRRHMVKDLGLSRKQVSFMGYWKRGRASS
ncbi:siderophore-interacting protein [Sediminivirga luteola]|uniref:FAD-binding FR-type domain-containing protein n=1 Tax=Sediminivirga luteola TaxID=1774748 RepID=A0A8J2XLH0_9MICO|nr:siderophore-interacting protein [Sediminivirga luteola]GGA18009.1 hypothetical protein GCM10011333_21450 [Sediminivirga luteola]